MTSSHDYYTIDIKLSSILIALGLKRRVHDPITCMVQDKGGKTHDQFTFWIDVADKADFDKCAKLVDAYYKFTKDGILTLDEDHPIYYMVAAFQNRDRQLDEMRKNVTAMKTVRKGGITMIVPVNPSELLKTKLYKL